MEGFAALGLTPALLDRLAEQGLTEPTPIQSAAIPLALAGRDLIGLAQTGTGKTVAYALPLIQRLAAVGAPPAPAAPRALVLAPTRELATQIAASLKAFARFSHVKPVAATGGTSLARQAERLAEGVDILVATPGRLIDHLRGGTVSLADVRSVVLDEADHMLGLGFLPALKRIGEALPARRQTLLFSATMPEEVETLARKWLRDPIRLAATPPGRPAERIAQAVHFTSARDKATLLRAELSAHPGERALVFVATRERAEKLAELLIRWGFSATAIHGDRTPAERAEALAALKSGAVTTLVATDLAGRGLDLPQVAHVYNHDLPRSAEAYIHRIGRTARAGAAGRALSFCAPAEAEALATIEAALGAPLPTAGGTRPAPPPEAPRRVKKPRHVPRKPAGQ